MEATAAANKEQPPFCNVGPGAVAAAALSGTGRGDGGEAAGCREEPVLGLLPAACEAMQGGRCRGGGVAASRPPEAALVPHAAPRSSSGASPRAVPMGLGRRWRCPPFCARISVILIAIREQWSLPRTAPSADFPRAKQEEGRRNTHPSNLNRKSKRNSPK